MFLSHKETAFKSSRNAHGNQKWYIKNVELCNKILLLLAVIEYILLKKYMISIETIWRSFALIVWDDLLLYLYTVAVTQPQEYYADIEDRWYISNTVFFFSRSVHLLFGSEGLWLPTLCLELCLCVKQALDLVSKLAHGHRSQPPPDLSVDQTLCLYLGLKHDGCSERSKGSRAERKQRLTEKRR